VAFRGNVSPQRPATRREFLQGRAAAQAAQDLVRDAAGAVGGDGSRGAASTPSRYLVQIGRRAMACQFEVVLNAGQYEQANEAAIEALDRVDQIEQQLSIYRPQSEVSRLNRAAGGRRVPVSPELFALVEQARRLHDQTGGALDITSGPLSAAWGFLQRTGHLPTAQQLAAARQRVGSRHLELDPGSRSIRYLRAGMEINFNSMGKGYALDQCAAALRRAGLDDFLVHGGQSSMLASGDQASTPARGWPVGLRHPLRPQQRLATLCLRHRALATSGAGTQYFHHEGKRYGHLIDPRTGRPAERVFSTTVLAPTAAEADALATAFYVMGPQAAAAFCRNRPELAAILVCPHERPGSIVLHVRGLDPDQWQLLDDQAKVVGPDPRRPAGRRKAAGQGPPG